MFVSVIIPTRNRSQQVLRAVDALLHQTYPAGLYEVIVCCDGCSDGSEERLKEIADPRLKVLAIPPSGQVAALNTCIGQAKGELAIFLDDEMEAETGLIQAHADAHARAGDGPIAITGFADVILDDDAPPAMRNLAQSYVDYYRTLDSPDHQFRPLDLNGGHFSVKLGPLRHVGCFNERYYFQRNDFELAARWLERGYRIGYAKQARARMRICIAPMDMIDRARARGQADYQIACEHSWCVPWLAFNSAFTNARLRRRWRLAWTLAAPAAPVLKVLYSVWPESPRLYNLAYFAEYVIGLNSAAGRWENLMTMAPRTP